MASELLKTFQKIERGRLSCIEKIRELGYDDVTNDASLDTIRTYLDRAGNKGEWEDGFYSLLDTSSGANITKWPEHVTEIGDYALYKKTNFNVNILPDTITSVGRYGLAYLDFTGKEYLPDSIERLNGYAVYGCKLQDLKRLPSNLKFIGDACFKSMDLASLEELPANVTIDFNAFYECQLPKLKVWGNNMSTVEVEDSQSNYAIFCNIEFTELEEFPDTMSIKNIKCFSGCTFPKLTKFFNTLNYTTRQTSNVGAFYQCTFSVLEHLPDTFELSNYLFYYTYFPELKNMTKRSIPKYCFYYGKLNKIKELNLSYCGDYAFCYTTLDSIERITIEGDGIYGFQGTTSFPLLKEISLGEDNKSHSYTYCFSGRAMPALEKLTLKGSISGTYAFQSMGANNLTSIEGSVTNLGRDFFRSANLAKVTELPNTIKTLDYGTFQYTKLDALTKLPDALTTMGEYCFANATLSMTTLELPKGVTYMITRCFQYCSTIKTIIVNANTFSFHSYGLQNMTGLTTLVFPNITSVPGLSTGISTLLSGSSGISASAGYVYVPAHLVDSMKAHNYWKTLANRIKPLEDWSGYQDYLATHSTEE